MLPLGSVCKVLRTSMANMKMFEIIKSKNKNIICPCHILSSDRFILERPFNSEFAILSLENNREKIAIIRWQDIGRIT